MSKHSECLCVFSMFRKGAVWRCSTGIAVGWSSGHQRASKLLCQGMEVVLLIQSKRQLVSYHKLPSATNLYSQSSPSRPRTPRSARPVSPRTRGARAARRRRSGPCRRCCKSCTAEPKRRRSRRGPATGGARPFGAFCLESQSNPEG